MVSPKLLEGDS